MPDHQWNDDPEHLGDHDGHTINVGPVTVGEPLDAPPLGVPARRVLVAEAESEGAPVDEYIRYHVEAALARGWRPSVGQQEDLLIDPEGNPLPPTEAQPVIVGDHADALPMRRREPPPKPLPPQPSRPDPLPIRFARQVLAMDPPPAPGEWIRLDQPVSRSIVSKKCREFADAYGVKLSIRVDHVDPDNPQSESKPHLWCCILAPNEDDLDIEIGADA